MLKKKIIGGLLAASLILVAMTSTVLAAPSSQVVNEPLTPPAPIEGTIQSITILTNGGLVTTVQVTLLDATNTLQTVTLTQDQAIALGLVTLDVNNVLVVNDAMVGTSVTVQAPSANNPPAQALADFFGLDTTTLNGFQAAGFGNGVIAQACYMSFDLVGDNSQCAAILLAKQTGDFNGITLPDGSTPTNWGQFKKSVGGVNGKQNLGGIMSGHAVPPTTVAPVTVTSNSSQTGAANGNGNGKSGNNGKSNGHSNAKGPKK